MKGITIKLAYAWATAAGHKPVENRGQYTPYRGPVVICAGAEWSIHGATDPRVLRAWWGNDSTEPLDPADFGPWFRRALAVAELIDCHHAEPGCCRTDWADPTYRGKRATHLVWGRRYRLTHPTHVVGRQSMLFDLRPAEADAVRGELAADLAELLMLAGHLGLNLGKGE